MIVRPFITTKDNIIKIINKIGYTLLICSLLYYNKESHCSEQEANIIIYSLLSLSMVTTLISLIVLVITFLKKCYEYWNSKK